MLIWDQKYLFFNLERICTVLSLRGIKRACIWHSLEHKHIKTHIMLIRHLNWILKGSNAYLVSKQHYFYDSERICTVLSIRGIKRACVWQALDT